MGIPTKSAEQGRARRLRLTAEGLCNRCGVAPRPEKGAICRECLDRAKERRTGRHFGTVSRWELNRQRRKARSDAEAQVLADRREVAAEVLQELVGTILKARSRC